MAFDWASRRKLMIFGGASALLILLIAGTWIAIWYRAPSCVDGKQDGDEAGVDCGGGCTYLCNADLEAPEVLFVRAVPNGAGRVDAIAYIKNPNLDAEASRVPYTLTLYGTGSDPVANLQGTIDLASRSIVPLFIPGAGNQGDGISRAYLTIGDAHWTHASNAHALPAVTGAQLSGGGLPRLTATVANTQATPLYGIDVVATVFDADGNALGASETVLRELEGQGSATVIFTWPAPFQGTPVRIEVLPVPSVP